jgi:hypothetical protein
MRAINSSQATFAASCANGYYAQTLEDLYLPSANGTRFIGDDLNVTGIVKSTYTINLTGSTNPAPGTAPVSCNGGAMGEGYFATADPPVTTDMRYFGTNTSGTLYYNLTNQVSVTDLTAGNGTPLQ